ncbi:Ger(x)C family spore germination protein [Paenibacillus arenilitoris]|uniref:Ger(X)C family spore germination protein n=1 Tax=Paenibacillus arenilitoris TaxID=2772299 RepID=A0A927H4F7_9BACL|nr:Ger(x)C family spore germination protein [Paenibacillus arenilitoris]MBD2868351.1 Ger(x)C family spore germination protein [Paenibacillus arenilitoris]
MSGHSAKGRLRGMAAMKVKAVLLLSACSILLGGCWDLRYLDKLGVVMALGVDVDPTGKQELRLTAQVVLAQNVAAESKGGIGGAPVTTFTETGNTMFEAIRKMSAKTSRRLFFSHTQMLIIGEKMARRGIYPLVDLIERNPDIRTDISVMVARGLKAEQLLQTTTQMESIPINQMHEMIEVNQESYGMNYVVEVNELIRMTGKGQQQAVLPSIRLEGRKEMRNKMDNLTRIPASAYPALSTLAAFKEGKLVDFLKPKESRGLAWLQDEVKSTIITLACPNSDGHLVVEVHDASRKYKVEREPDGMPLIKANLLVTGSIQEIMCPGVDVGNEGTIDEIGLLASGVVKSEAEAAIRKAQQSLRSDVLGWGLEVYLKEPAIWKRLEKDWERRFPEVASEVTCTANLIGSGVRGESIVK